MAAAEPFPPTLAAALRPTLPQLAAETIAAIGAEVPDYARPLEGPFGRALRLGVERALSRFVDELEGAGATAGDGASEIYSALGRAEQRAGRTLDALLSAYRLGARLAWERFAELAEAAGLAGWRRPARVAALVARDDEHASDADRLAARLGPDAVAAPAAG